MTRVYKTAKGKMIDMDQVKLANESSIAVGNMKVNARGDVIGSGGKVATGRNQLMDRVYQVDPVDPPGYSPNDPESYALQAMISENNKAKALHDLTKNLVQTADSTEPMVNDSTPTEPAARGSLASAVAKTVSVTQAPLPDPKKPTGPSRI